MGRISGGDIIALADQTLQARMAADIEDSTGNTYHSHLNSVERACAAFDACDVDKDGLVSVHELMDLDILHACFDIAGQAGADFVENLGVSEFTDLLKVRYPPTRYPSCLEKHAPPS